MEVGQIVFNFIIKSKGDIRSVTKKKLDCINHALGTMPIGRQLAHCETQLLSSIVSQFL